MAVWILIPDKIDDEAAGGTQRFGVFGTTLVAFFLAEMGDKTQIATVALAARSLSGILCARHSMTTRSMNATQDEDRCGGPGGAAANSG